ncbi:restriction endonuclease subunit S [Aeromonas caviae]|uniref:restriction endonuclease subunit S n=1 Tax=Aeromonas caviae TaxID=648 RepID=UPI001CC4C516|nr:restriction endonuclease subunit S [Aeromonas caviae]GJA16589.1 restriction modification system DNA specificity domain-containing protein [Aeromonas caviae]GJA23009.1 restriction modification system DNA specificity domain-containing protein [Aeromonas caviae]GJB21708.1 restriction modification system DNA specificity domain-containing protein [Aeromonas caviae]
MSVIEHQAERVGKYQPYPEYNNSGYSWMAKIPSGWLNGPLKRIAYLQAGFAFKGDTFNTSEGVPIVRMNNILNSGGLSLDDAVRVPEIDVKPEFYLATGDIVMGMSGSIENIAKVQGDDLPCALNQRVGRFVLRAVDDGFLWYLIQSNGFKQQVSLAATGTAQLNISSDQVGNTLVSWPVSLLEQNIIAAFLDYETARIDRLIAQQQRLIELLKEKRQAVISHTVIKGLNPNAVMKKSGIEWFGQVPVHWDASQLKYIVKLGTSITYGIVQAGPHIEDGIPYIKTSDMSGTKLPLDGYSKTSPEIDASYSRSKVYSGDLVIAIRATVGKCHIVPDAINGANLTQGTAKISPSEKITSEFLYLLIMSSPVQLYFDANAKGATFREITLEMLRRTPIVIPPLSEQKLICEYINKTVSIYDRLISKCEFKISLLVERRAALISAAVTGKIDLRGWTPPAEEAAA